MIVSASRRTDIPAFYPQWMLNRLREGHVLVPNPFDRKSVSRVNLDPAGVDCIVFWTKNPAPMLSLLDGLRAYTYYFQFTLNPYGPDAEPDLPAVARRIETFKRLAEAIGPERTVWRYDPLFVSDRYTASFHREAFARLAEALGGYTERCMLGFLDPYPHIRKTLETAQFCPLPVDAIDPTAAAFKQAADRCGIRLVTCTEKVDLRHLGIPAGSCVDRELVERLTGYRLSARKDKNQGKVCRCIESVDIGMYESCAHGCVYCYAIRNSLSAARNRARHDPDSPQLIGRPTDARDGVVIRERKMTSLRCDQPTLL